MHYEAIQRAHLGAMLVTQDRNAARQFPRLNQVLVRAKVNDLITERGELGSGHNSGFQALNLALQFGARRMVLVGYDCSLRQGAHWHGKHTSGLNNPTQAGVDNWRAHLDRQAPLLKLLGVDVRLASPGSTLQCYRQYTLEEALR